MANGGAATTATTDASAQSIVDASSPCSYSEASSVTYEGSVELSYLADASVQYWVEGGFGKASLGSASTCSNGTLVGACCFISYANGLLVLPESIPTAGQLAVYDSQVEMTTLEAGNYLQSSEFANTLHWSPGDTLRLSASGAEVAAFEASVIAPAMPSGVIPELSASFNMSLSADYTMSWHPEGYACEKVILTLTTDTAGMTCTADDAAGALTVPSALMAHFSSQTVTAELGRQQSVFLSTADARIKIDALSAHTSTVTLVP